MNSRYKIKEATVLREFMIEGKKIMRPIVKHIDFVRPKEKSWCTVCGFKLIPHKGPEVEHHFEHGKGYGGNCRDVDE